VQWKCEAELDVGVRFGATDVTCEGYDFADDPYILQGRWAFDLRSRL